MADFARHCRTISREMRMSDLALQLACPQSGEDSTRMACSARVAQPLSPIKKNWGLEFIAPSDKWEPVRPFVVWRFSGRLRVDCLARAAREMVRRHAILCCDLRHVQGGWRYVPGFRRPPELRLWDLAPAAATSTANAETQAIQRVRNFIILQRGADAERIVRLGHVRVAEEDHLIGISVHHSFCDQYSMRIVSYELGALYDAFCRGQESPLADLPLGYLEHMLAVDEWSRGAEARAHIAFWLRYLDGAVGVRRADKRQIGVSHFRLSPECSAALNLLARQERAGPSLVWEALHHATLHRLLQRNDVTTLSIDAGRRRKELIPLIGELVNLLPVRSELSGTLTFRELLRKVRDDRQNCAPHVSTPYDLVAAQCAVDFTSTFGALNYIPRTFAILDSFGPKVQIPIPLGNDYRPPYLYSIAVVDDQAAVSVACMGDNLQPFTIAELARALELMTNRAAVAADAPLGSLLP